MLCLTVACVGLIVKLLVRTYHNRVSYLRCLVGTVTKGLLLIPEHFQKGLLSYATKTRHSRFDLGGMQQQFCPNTLRHLEHRYAIDVKHTPGRIKYPGPYWILG